ncbi:hypothetical protein SPHINGO8BC_90640 [Sphingobacterium multivorum]|uniref:Uncharacterized protein n=1 Tax=Sphingobacterium multivorum TaxID=28454 RepID=A0A654DRS4_SPHMU|nr:hypothetical protein SPHINGO8BC_90640 [Sphingobacterium multivorum]
MKDDGILLVTTPRNRLVDPAQLKKLEIVDPRQYVLDLFQ